MNEYSFLYYAFSVSIEMIHGFSPVSWFLPPSYSTGFSRSAPSSHPLIQLESSPVQADLGGSVGLVPEHCNKADVAVKRIM